METDVLTEVGPCVFKQQILNQYQENKPNNLRYRVLQKFIAMIPILEMVQ